MFRDKRSAVRYFVGFAAFLTILTAAAWAGEAGGERPRRPDGELPRRAREGEAPAARSGEQGVVWAEARMNVIDRARFETARLHFRNQRYKEAAAEMAAVVEQSPDPWAVAAAHLDLGTLNRRYLGNLEKAIQEYTLVKGELQPMALQQIVSTYEELGQWEKAAELMQGLVEKAPERREQVELLYRMADLYQRYGQDDRAIETLQRIAKTVTYAEAEDWRQATQMRGRPEGQPPQALRERIERLRAEGRNEEADRLERMLPPPPPAENARPPAGENVPGPPR